MKIYQYAKDGIIPKVPAYCIGQMVKLLPSGYTHELITRYEFYESPDINSDALRLDLCSSEDCIWFDWDIMVRKWFKPDKFDKPYISDNCEVIIVNKCTDFFKEMFKTVKANKSKYMYRGFLQDLIHERKKDYYELPEGYFIHIMYDGFVKSKKAWTVRGNKYFSMDVEGNITLY